jgi:ubiquinone/menaquinone biosynthesis C-methylase UbiE
MVKDRILETNEGIQGEFDTEVYDKMMRVLRDKKYMETGAIIKSGICKGSALEVGPGPGYLGLEWLKNTKDTKLTGLEISPNMIKIAKRNAVDYGMENRVSYVLGNAMEMPFNDNEFDAVFTNGSLHEWEEPVRIFNEIYRILKRGGRYFISDLRRDMNFFIKWFLKSMTRPREMVDGLVSSINAAYIENEIRTILADSDLKNGHIKMNPIGLEITGGKG